MRGGWRRVCVPADGRWVFFCTDAAVQVSLSHLCARLGAAARLLAEIASVLQPLAARRPALFGKRCSSLCSYTSSLLHSDNGRLRVRSRHTSQQARAMLASLYAIAALAQLTYASDPLSYHGGSILALAGRDAAVLVLDKRIGAGNNLIGDECCRVLEASKRALLAVRGIQGDVQSLLEDVAARLRLRRLEEGDDACLSLIHI